MVTNHLKRTYLERGNRHIEILLKVYGIPQKLLKEVNLLTKQPLRPPGMVRLSFKENNTKHKYY